MLDVAEFRPERHRLHKPSLREMLALNGGELPPLAGGANQSWSLLFNAFQSANQAGAAYNNSKAIKDISPGGAVAGEACTIAGGSLVPGQLIRCTAKGWFSTKAATKPTFIMGLYWGGVAGTALAVTGTNETPEGAAELPWVLEATIVIRSINLNAVNGKAVTQGTVVGLGTPKAAVSAGVTAQHLPATKPQTEVAINTATQNVLTVGGTWGTESAENTLTVTQWLVETLC